MFSYCLIKKKTLLNYVAQVNKVHFHCICGKKRNGRSCHAGSGGLPRTQRCVRPGGRCTTLLGVGESDPAHARLPYRIWCTLAFRLYFSRLIFPSETQH